MNERRKWVKEANLARQLDPLAPFIHALSAAVFYCFGHFDEAEREAAQALDQQHGYVFGSWIRGLALMMLGRHGEAVEMLERTVSLSRAPFFVGMLGLVYARGGRVEDAQRLLSELDERSSRGEHVEPLPSLCIHIGLGDVAEIRKALRKAIEESTPPLALKLSCDEFLKPFRSDPDINRMLIEYLES